MLAGIMRNGRALLQIFDGGTLTSQRYCIEIFLHHVRLFRGTIRPDFLFMGDNARPHRTIEVSDTLAGDDIQRMT